MNFGFRLKAFYKSLNLSNQEFAKILKKRPAHISSYVNERGYPDFNTLILIKENFPELSMDWLLTGEGEMLKSERLETTTKNDIPLSIAREEMELMKKSINYLLDEVEKLKVRKP